VSESTDYKGKTWFLGYKHGYTTQTVIRFEWMSFKFMRVSQPLVSTVPPLFYLPMHHWPQCFVTLHLCHHCSEIIILTL
jgi:hypothetical protein